MATTTIARAPWFALVVLLIVAAALHATPVAAASTEQWTPSSLPNPVKDPAACGRPDVPSSAVCDPDAVLSRSSGGADVVEGLLAGIRAAAPPYARSPCASRAERKQGAAGYPVAVALVSRMAREVEGIGEEDPEGKSKAFAKRLHDLWGVGRSCGGRDGDKSDDGVVIFLSVQDRQAYVSTGREAAAKLPDATLAAILAATRSPLRRGDYGGAVSQLVADVGLALAGKLDPGSLLPGGDGGGGGGGDEDEDTTDDNWQIFAFFAAIFASVFGWSWWSDRRANERLEACRAKLEAIRQEAAARAAGARGGGDGGGGGGSVQQQHEYGASPTCPVCLERYEGEVAAGEEEEEEDREEEGGGGAKAAAAAAAAATASLAVSSSCNHQQPRRHKVLLACGHAACQPCLEAWMGVQGRNTCPVCRAAAGGVAAGAAGATAVASSSAAPTAAATTRDDLTSTATTSSLWYPELAFRLGRLRALYPDLVSADLGRRWERDALLGRFDQYDSFYADDFYPSQLRRHEALSGRRREYYERMGAGGAIGGGFGGGSGGGGGGGGGGAGTSW
jgi:uncharacterized membrane protein YgcG